MTERTYPPVESPSSTIAGAAKNYTLLYLVAAALTFLGAVAIMFVRKVK